MADDTVSVRGALLEEHLMCPICFCVIRGPIMQCIEGHIICVKCLNGFLKRLQKKCYICCQPVVGRNRALEALRNDVLFLCDFGCGYMVLNKEWEEHAELCPNRPKNRRASKKRREM